MKGMGSILLIAGAALGGWGYHLSQSLSSRVSQFLNGSPSDQAMWAFVAAAVCVGLGLFQLYRARR